MIIWYNDIIKLKKIYLNYGKGPVNHGILTQMKPKKKNPSSPRNEKVKRNFWWSKNERKKNHLTLPIIPIIL